MRDFDAAVADMLGSLAGETTAEGEASVSRLVQALHAFARKLDKSRDEMQADLSGLRCGDCGKGWTAPITVKREREWGLPDNCPVCYNDAQAAKGESRRSGHTDTFRYVNLTNWSNVD